MENQTSDKTIAVQTSPVPLDPLLEELLVECEVMAMYILDQGKTKADYHLADLVRIREDLGRGKATNEDLKDLSKIHTRFSKIIQPALPVTLVHLEEDRQKEWGKRLAGHGPFVRRLLVGIVLFLLLFLVFASQKEVNYQSIRQSLFDSQGNALIMNLGFLLSVAGLGALFAIGYEAFEKLAARNLIPHRVGTYWARLVLGIVAGFILSELISVGASGNDPVTQSNYEGSYQKLDSVQIESLIALTPAEKARLSPAAQKSVLMNRRLALKETVSNEVKREKGAALKKVDPKGGSSQGILKVILALLGGFSATLLFNILHRLANGLESIVSNGGEELKRIKEIKGRIQEHEDQRADQEKGKSQKVPPGEQLVSMERLKAMLPYGNPVDLKKYLDPLNKALVKYDINTPLRIVNFIAQVAEETISLSHMTEIGSGDAYNGRKDLGNNQPGDGPKYKGRGFLQLTGRANYASYNDYLQGNNYPLKESLLEDPDQVASPELAADSGGWFWRIGQGHDLNLLADQDNVKEITRLINGGYNGLDEREQNLAIAKKAWGL